MATKRTARTRAPKIGALELAQDPSPRALRELPARVGAFLRTVSSQDPVRTALESAGYGPSDHHEALALFIACCPYRSGGFDPRADQRSRHAAAGVATWVRTHFPRYHAALARLHPEYAPRFAVPVGMSDAQAVLVGATALEQLQRLCDEAPEPPVVRTLARRGLSLSERQRFAELIRCAQQVTEPLPNRATDLARGAANGAAFANRLRTQSTRGKVPRNGREKATGARDEGAHGAGRVSDEGGFREMRHKRAVGTGSDGSGAARAGSAGSGAARAGSAADADAALRALHAWYVDWGATARVVIRRKDWLIALGLARRGK